MVSSKPVITRSQVVAQTRLFQVEQIGLRFSNGNEVEYERLRSPGRGADPGETPEQAAGREIKEEVGYGANKLRLLRELSVAPGYSDYRTYIILATDLYKQKLPGDEPEEIEVVPWRMSDLSRLLQRKDFVEARSIAALYLLQHAL
jgi:ADP-ribose diphosphatase